MGSVLTALFGWVSSYCSLVSGAAGARSDRDPVTAGVRLRPLGRSLPRGSYGPMGEPWQRWSTSCHTLLFHSPNLRTISYCAFHQGQLTPKNVGLSCRLTDLLVRATFPETRALHLVVCEHLKERVCVSVSLFPGLGVLFTVASVASIHVQRMEEGPGDKSPAKVL